MRQGFEGGSSSATLTNTIFSRALGMSSTVLGPKVEKSALGEVESSVEALRGEEAIEKIYF